MESKVKELFDLYKIDSFKLNNQLGGTDAIQYIIALVEILAHDIKKPRDIKENKDFAKLISNNKKITEVQIIRGGIPYTFKNDVIILNLFEKTINENTHPLRLSELRRADYWFGFGDNLEELRDCFSRINQFVINKNEIYRFLFDLLILAGYKPNSQRPIDDDKSKCAFMRNVIQRNKNLKIR